MDSEEAVINLIETLSDENLETLLSLFQSSNSTNGYIELSFFKQVLGKILQVSEHDERLSVLCKKIDNEEDGLIDEGKLMAYLLQQCKEKHELTAVKVLPFQKFPVFIQNIYSKQTTCRFLSLTLPPRFISVSKDGVIATWSGSLELQKGMIMDDKATVIDHNQLTRSKRNTTLWITDTTIISICNIIVIAATSRELFFYDITSSIYKCLHKLCDLPSIPLCLTSYINSDKSCYIFIGDSGGSAIVLHFKNPLSSLFVPSNKDTSSSDDDIQSILYTHLPEHIEYVSLTYLPHTHMDWIQRIMYLPQNHSIITCSTHHQNSLVVRSVDGKLKPYIFNLPKGVLCFDFNFELNFLVTGSPDHIVRFWDPYVPSSPMAILNEHVSPVIDVLIHKEMNIVYSFSRDLTLCAWDLLEHTHLQTIPVKFSFSQRQPDFSLTVLCLFSQSKLAVMCNEYIAVFTLSSTEFANEGVTTHSKPLIAAHYDPRFQQVVSGCETGEICIWNITNGSKVWHIKNCHNENEMTFISFDDNGRRLITGSRYGEIKVWSYINGECLHEMHTLGSTEVTGVIHLPDKTQFISVGWNKRITSFSDEPDVYRLKPDNIWSKNAPHHNDDILTISYCPPYIATGSFDGDIIVWNIDTTNSIAHFKSLTKIRAAMNIKLLKRSSFASISKSETASRSSHSSLSRPASRRHSSRLQSNSSCYFQNVPVDKLLFLKKRTSKKKQQQKQSFLVSSEAGNCRFWNFPGEKEPQGTFSLTCNDRSVLALCSDPDNQYLIAGDTEGTISLFDISTYCTGLENETPQPVSMVTWQAHSQEIMAVEYIAHETQPLILSSSCDCNVRLWNIKGHYIGTFGQNKKWKLSDSATFQCLLTPKDTVSVKVADDTMQESSNAENESEALEKEQLNVKSSLVSTPTESRSSLQEADEPSLFDKKLYDQYVDKVDKRMIGKQERRQCYADVDMSATEKFGSLCSPFQALQLLQVDDLKFPKTVSDLLHNN